VKIFRDKTWRVRVIFEKLSTLKNFGEKVPGGGFAGVGHRIPLRMAVFPILVRARCDSMGRNSLAIRQADHDACLMPVIKNEERFAILID
jgi:hypothetical protein